MKRVLSFILIWAMAIVAVPTGVLAEDKALSLSTESQVYSASAGDEVTVKFYINPGSANASVSMPRFDIYYDNEFFSNVEILTTEKTIFDSSEINVVHSAGVVTIAATTEKTLTKSIPAVIAKFTVSANAEGSSMIATGGSTFEGFDNYEEAYAIVTTNEQFMVMNEYLSETNDNLIAPMSVISYDTGAIIDLAFYDDEAGYNEKDRKGNQTFEVTFKNTSSQTRKFSPVFAVYSANGVLKTIKTADTTVPANTTRTAHTTLNINTVAATDKIQAMVWDLESAKPYVEPLSLTSTATDFYGNSFALSTLINDISIQVAGSINTSGDTDYLRFVAPNTGSYTFRCFSTSGVTAALYSSSQSIYNSSFTTYTRSLIAGSTYYVKIFNSSGTGDYVFTIENAPSSAAQSFNVYNFDADVNIYKQSILKLCNDLYYDNKALSKEAYAEYERVLSDDSKLHTLPAFLTGHPKNVTNFDTLINQYYGTKYNKFMAIKQRYLDVIDNYSELSSTSSPSPNASFNSSAESMIPANTQSQGDPEEYMVGELVKMPDITVEPEEIEENQTMLMAIAATPSLTIVSTTATSITYNVVFPTSGAQYNCMWLTDFNTSNGLTSNHNVYGDDNTWGSHFERPSGTFTINSLVPGGVYVLMAIWAPGGWQNQDAICRVVKLPYNTTETIGTYQNSNGRVTAKLETADKALTSSGNFDTWLSRMDSVYDKFKELTGYTPYNSQKIVMQSTRANLNDYFGIQDGNNYYWVIYGYYDYTATFKYGQPYYKGLMRRLSSGDWGWLTIHEMGHVFDNYKWEFDPETLAQFKTYYVMEQLNAKVYDVVENAENPYYTGNAYYNYLKYDRYMESYTYSFNNNYYASEGFAAILIDIQKTAGVGWEPFKRTFRYFNDLGYSQVPSSNGGKLRLFLTKLKDYSGVDVISKISSRDKGIIGDHFGITLDYVTPPYPSIPPGSGGGGGGTIDVPSGSYSVYQFTPETSGNYNIYTSPFGGSGVSNDTYLEVYTNASLTGTPIASNDDYDGGRFSKVTVAMSAGTTYYIKIRHYSSGQIHADLNITKNTPVQPLTIGGYNNIITASGEFALFSYTPAKSGQYTFAVDGYNGGSQPYDTYIKLYDSENLTYRIAHNENIIIANLNAGQTYYLQFSGYLMKYARGRINVRQAAVVEFKKKTDSSFIYVNNPEFITKYDIVDDNTPLPNSNIIPRLKIFEQRNVSGKNTFYQTHITRHTTDGSTDAYPNYSFYFDIDFYNPGNSDVTVSISNLAYSSNDASVLRYYYGGGANANITVPAKSHILLLEYLNSPLQIPSSGFASMFALFDMNVTGGNITISSLMAKNRSNLVLRYNTERVLNSSGIELNGGEVLHDNSQDSGRKSEGDLQGKYKGIARNQANQIDINLELAVDDNTQSGIIPIQMKDNFYPNVWGPGDWWMTQMNPLHDEWDGLLYAMPGNLHKFTYHHEETDRLWYFDIEHRNGYYFTENGGSNVPVNDYTPNDIIDNAKSDVAEGAKNHFSGVPDIGSLGMGSWGVVYHYTITVSNSGREREVSFCVRNSDNLVTGYKMPSENNYTTSWTGSVPYNVERAVATITVPAYSTKTFEVVTLSGIGNGGLNNMIKVN